MTTPHETPEDRAERGAVKAPASDLRGALCPKCGQFFPGHSIHGHPCLPMVQAPSGLVSETPRTDAVFHKVLSMLGHSVSERLVLMLAISRMLERELSAANARVKELEEQNVREFRIAAGICEDLLASQGREVALREALCQYGAGLVWQQVSAPNGELVWAYDFDCGELRTPWQVAECALTQPVDRAIEVALAAYAETKEETK